MRFAITADHREFFTKNHYIEFEELLNRDQVASLKKNVEETVAKRLRIPLAKLKEKSPPEVYQAGYDLWRESDGIKKIAHKQAFAALASELMQIIPIRYGFDQYFATTHCTGSPYDLPLSLQDISCLNPLAGALLLPLEDLASPPTFFPMPLKMGSGLFLSPTFSLPWPQLFSTRGLCFFLIVYAKEKTSFRADSHDPHAVSLKKLGYAYNELLKDSIHPIVLREIF
ncbi:MAG: hypothetical protein WA347_05615 [Rhabdochlamydiaceae bacterium]|jgi:hypothetical protein